MRWFKLTLAYDGSRFAGWQVQPNQRTVQETLQRILTKITGEEIRAVASGRTDAGVHALGQVVSIKTGTHLSPSILQRALNAELPEDIVVLEVRQVRDGFHAIRDAVRKRYRYQLFDGPVRDVFRRSCAWVWPLRLNAAAMHGAAQHLRGTHDFCSFQSVGAERKSSVRTIHEIEVRRGVGADRDLIRVEIEADGFLYNMARAIVGTLVEVGRGAFPETHLRDVLTARDRKRAGMTAPPQGLFLVRVEYE